VSDLAFAFVCPSLGRPETEENDLADLLDFFFSQVVAAVQSSLLFLNVSRGLGTSIDLLDPGVIQGIQHVCAWELRDPQSGNAN
jgi:hypothetical protein